MIDVLVCTALSCVYVCTDCDQIAALLLVALGCINLAVEKQAWMMGDGDLRRSVTVALYEQVSEKPLESKLYRTIEASSCHCKIAKGETPTRATKHIGINAHENRRIDQTSITLVEHGAADLSQMTNSVRNLTHTSVAYDVWTNNTATRLSQGQS